MAAHRYDPPQFITDASGYADYKRKLERWSRITKVEKAKQAEVVLYHLEGHPSGIQEKIDASIGDELVDNDDGLALLIAFLDRIYAKDEMADAWEKYKKFVHLKKRPEQPITEFIAEFEKTYLKAKEGGCEFSDTVLAFNLLEACDLSATDEKFILTAVDFANGKERKNLADQVKLSLRKFQSRETISQEHRAPLKVEESLVAGVKEVLLAEGWRPPHVSGQSGNQPKGRRNPLGANGKPLRCFHCQSEFHMIDRCTLKKEQKGQAKFWYFSTRDLTVNAFFGFE